MKRKRRDKKKDEILNRIMEDERTKVLHLVDKRIRAYEHVNVNGILKRLMKVEKEVYEFEKMIPEIQNTLNIIWSDKHFEQYRKEAHWPRRKE